MMKWLSALILLMDDLMSLQNHDQKIKKKIASLRLSVLYAYHERKCIVNVLVTSNAKNYHAL